MLLHLPTPGCVRELQIQGEEIVFHDLNLTAHGISHCPTCRDQPCQVTPHLTWQGPVESRGGPECSRPDLWGLPYRMGAGARTRRAAATCAPAQLASLGAAVSTPRPCTATQVCTHPLITVTLGTCLCAFMSTHTPTANRACYTRLLSPSCLPLLLILASISATLILLCLQSLLPKYSPPLLMPRYSPPHQCSPGNYHLPVCYQGPLPFPATHVLVSPHCCLGTVFEEHHKQSHSFTSPMPAPAQPPLARPCSNPSPCCVWPSPR